MNGYYFYLGAQTSVVKLGCACWGSGSAGAVARLGLYNVDSAGYPTTLIVDGGTVAVTANNFTTLKTVSFTAVVLPAGTYYAAIAQQGGATTRATYLGIAQAFPYGPITFGGGDLSTGASGWVGYRVTSGVTGALPSTWPAGATPIQQNTTHAPFVWVGA